MSKNHLHTRTRHHFGEREEKGGRWRRGGAAVARRRRLRCSPLFLTKKRALLRASIHITAWVPPRTLGPSRTTAVPPTWVSPRPRATWYKRHHRLVTQHQAELEISLSTGRNERSHRHSLTDRSPLVQSREILSRLISENGRITVCFEMVFLSSLAVFHQTRSHNRMDACGTQPREGSIC